MESNVEKNAWLSKRGKTLGLVLIVAATLLVVVLLTRNSSSQQETSMLAVLPAAFLSGVLSFLSPCSLPILPAYFAYSFQSDRKNVVLTTLVFFMGLATTMTILGASVSGIGSILVRNISAISTFGGLLIVIFGILSIFGKGFTGVQFQDRPARSIVGSFLYGATFAIGWTACIGPILGAILTLLATQGAGVLQGTILSFVYALGLGLPLILISTFFSRLGNGSRFWRFIRGKGFTIKMGNLSIDLHTTGLLGGLLLITIGILLATGELTQITRFALKSDLSLWVVEADEKLRVFFGIR